MPFRRLLACLSLLVLSGACADDTIAPPLNSGGTPRPLGLVEVAISGLGSDQQTASARVSYPSSSGARWNLSAPANGNTSGNGSIQLEPLSTGSFTTGVRGAGGSRYLWATFRVRNAQTDGTPYDTPRQNLTFFAVSTASTLGGTAVSSMARFDGSAAAAGVAAAVVPTGLVSQSPFSSAPLSASADVLQVLAEGEAAAVPMVSGATLLPYGFVTRSATGGRTLAASPAAGQYDGVVTFAFKLPLQATAADDPFSLAVLFQAVDDSETRVTQSLEEQTPAGEAAFVARAAQIGAATKTVLPGLGSYAGDAATTRTLCAVRTAGPSASPTAYLVNQPIASIQLTDPAPNWPLWAGGPVARRMAEARDGGGAALPSVPVQMSFGTAGVFQPWGNGGVRMVGRRDRATSTVTAGACGLSVTSAPLASSGFSPISGGDWVTLAIRSDGAMAAWGWDIYGQLTVPPGLTGVVQVAAGWQHAFALKSDGTMVGWGVDLYLDPAPTPPGLTGVVQVAAGGYHSVALKSDGTVVAWGDNSEGQATVPPGLTGVVQVAAGVGHSVALRSDGTVTAWGGNSGGETTVPAGLTGVVQVAAAEYYSLALRSDGTVVAWGPIGGGPAAVPPGLTGVVQVDVGNRHAMALKSDGTVVAWGGNTFGQTTVPPGLTGVVQIAAGTFHSLAARSDGTVVAWGDNNGGQMTVPPGLVAAAP